MASQPGWRWCGACQGLFFGGNNSNGVCPAGGEHNPTGSGNYVLTHNTPDAPGQHGWNWCSACEGLFFGPGGAGVCPAGGGHKGTSSGDYALQNAADAAAQSGWRWCSVCQGLFFSAHSNGTCPGGGQHNSLASGDYSLKQAPGSPAAFEPVAQGVSHVDPFAADGVVGQIFFPTDVAQTDAQDAKELDKIPPAYLPDLNVRRVDFTFRGFADHRPTAKHKDNLALSEARAASVRDFLQARFFDHPNFVPTIQAFGIHPTSKFAGSTSTDLKEFRRVDIIAAPAKAGKIAPSHSEPKPACPRATHFRIRLKAGASVGQFLAVENIIVEIHDPVNRRGMSFEYVGVGPTVGTSTVGAGTGFIDFTTSVPVCLEDFDGPAAHTGGIIAAGVGASFDLLDLLGPFHRRSANPVLLKFPTSASGPGANAGVAMGHSRGNLSPVNKGFPI